MQLPKPKTSPLHKIPFHTPSTIKLQNGLTLIHIKQRRLPLICFNLCFNCSPFNHALFPGYKQCLDELMGRGNTFLSQQDFYNQVDHLGAQLEFSLTNSWISGLSRFQDRLCELFSQAILHAQFLESELEKVKNQLRNELELSKNDPEFIARRSQKALTYGLNHPEGIFTTKEHLSVIKLNTLKKIYSDYIRPSNAYLIVYGNITLDETKALAQKYWLNWPMSPSYLSSSKAYSICKKNTLSCVSVSGAKQNIIAVTKAIHLPLNHPNHFDLLLANELLGGGSNGLLFQILREEKGYTYSAYSQLPRHKEKAILFKMISYSRPETTEESLKLMFQQLQKLYSQLVSSTQLNLVKEKLIGRFIRSLENPQYLIQCAYYLQTQALPACFYENYIDSIQSVSATTILNAVQNHLEPKAMKAIVVGSVASLFPNQSKVLLNNNCFSKHLFNSELQALN